MTLEQDGTALFPDAPTLRGLSHEETLRRLRSEGILPWRLSWCRWRAVSYTHLDVYKRQVYYLLFELLWRRYKKQVDQVMAEV